MCLFFLNDTATPETYPLSLHDALPISREHPAARPERRSLEPAGGGPERQAAAGAAARLRRERARLRRLHQPAAAGPRDRVGDRKSTRLNSRHANISYAVFCLKNNKQIE